MIKINDYRLVESLEEAYELNQKKNNRILGGMLWLKMGRGRVGTAIDLSGLGLDKIEENEEEISIGCMVTLRQMETNEGMIAYTNGAVKEALRHIVGVQFRNVATVGGSIYGRYGFSDVLTFFMAMETYVELYKGGILPIAEFAEKGCGRDIVVRLIVKKVPGKLYYQSVRNTQTDFPVLTCSSFLPEEKERGLVMAFGARPGRAVLLEGIGDFFREQKICPEHITGEQAELFGDFAGKQIVTASNLRGSKEYRSHLVEVLAQRAVLTLGGNADGN